MVRSTPYKKGARAGSKKVVSGKRWRVIMKSPFNAQWTPTIGAKLEFRVLPGMMLEFTGREFM